MATTGVQKKFVGRLPNQPSIPRLVPSPLLANRSISSPPLFRIQNSDETPIETLNKSSDRVKLPGQTESPLMKGRSALLVNEDGLPRTPVLHGKPGNGRISPESLTCFGAIDSHLNDEPQTSNEDDTFPYSNPTHIQPPSIPSVAIPKSDLGKPQISDKAIPTNDLKKASTQALPALLTSKISDDVLFNGIFSFLSADDKLNFLSATKSNTQNFTNYKKITLNKDEKEIRNSKEPVYEKISDLLLIIQEIVKDNKVPLSPAGQFKFKKIIFEYIGGLYDYYKEFNISIKNISSFEDIGIFQNDPTLLPAIQTTMGEFKIKGMYGTEHNLIYDFRVGYFTQTQEKEFSKILSGAISTNDFKLLNFLLANDYMQSIDIIQGVYLACCSFVEWARLLNNYYETVIVKKQKPKNIQYEMQSKELLANFLNAPYYIKYCLKQALIFKQREKKSSTERMYEDFSNKYSEFEDVYATHKSLQRKWLAFQFNPKNLIKKPMPYVLEVEKNTGSWSDGKILKFKIWWNFK